MPAGIEVLNDSDVLVLNSGRNALVLLAKNSRPAGTVLYAYGAAGATYAFGLASGPASYGLQTFGPDGSLLFDAVNFGRMARPVGIMTGNINPPTLTRTVSQTFPAGRTYAVAFHSPVSAIYVRNIAITVGGTINNQYALDSQEMVASVSGDTISITATRTEGNPQGTFSPTPYSGAGKTTWRAIVLDVTNF